jgi:hypothetical protein
MIMELDDLKQSWKQNPIKKDLNTDIMEIIQHKSYGPVAALKRTYAKQIRLMAILPMVLLLTNVNNIPVVLTSVLFWSYVAFCIGIVFFAYYNYRIVGKMEGMDGMVKTNLEQQIKLLEKRAKWEIIGMRCVMLFFIVLVEVVPFFQHYRMLDKWHSLPLYIRFGSYAALLLVQYFLNRKIKERKVGRHLAYLKALSKEMQD